MGIAIGASRRFCFKKQSGLGVVATNSGGQIMRRNTAKPKYERAKIASGEMRSDHQKAATRLGSVMVDLDYACDIVPGAHKEFYASFVRGTYSAAATTGALTTITAAATAPHFTRAAGSYLTDGFRVGDVVRVTGWAAPATANNSKNFVVYAVTATQLSVYAVDGSAVVAKAAGDSVTIALAGRKVFTPATGHVIDYYTTEDWQPEVPSSIVYSDLRPGSLSVDVKADGMATMQMPFMGRNATAPAATAYFTAPATAQTGLATTGTTGLVVVAGLVVGVITGIQFQASGDLSREAVLGSLITPDVFSGAIGVTGSFTALKADDAFHTLVRSGGTAQIIVVCTQSQAAGAEFVAFNMLANILGQDVDDTLKALKQTVNFEVANNDTAGADGVATTLIIQDSLAP